MKTKKSKNATKGSSELFDKAFEDASDLFEAEERLKDADYLSERSRLKKDIRKSNARLHRRTQWHHDINLLTSQYIDLHGGQVINIADLIDWLHKHGVKIVPDKSQGPGLTERAVRIHLQKAFGIEGKPGRKAR